MKRIIICLLAAALLIPVCAGAEGDTITYQVITVDRNAETVDLGKLRVQNYKEFYGTEPVVKTIHAGLECGIFADKIKKLDCISMGPDVNDIHTVNERLSVASAAKTYDFLLKLLESEIVKEGLTK